jgi:hypothetical protein
MIFISIVTVVVFLVVGLLFLKYRSSTNTCKFYRKHDSNHVMLIKRMNEIKRQDPDRNR